MLFRSPVGGKIVVTVEQWEMYVKVNVADTGKGISESNQAAIFRRFYREDRVHDKPGVGIGLYLAREISRGKYADAMNLADKELAVNPQNVNLRFLRGVIFMETKKNDEAKRVFEQLIREYMK